MDKPGVNRNQPSADLPYKDNDVDSVVSYAEGLVEHSLREVLGVGDLVVPTAKRGSFGSALETLYFQIPANNYAGADFWKIDVELKSTPMKKLKNGALSAKERLVLSMIDYSRIVDESWLESTLLRKTSKMLLIAYLYEKGKNPVDYKILLSKLWGIADGDLTQFESDWNVIQKKVLAGEAHTISCSDTMYLEACTKGANGKSVRHQPFSEVLAKPRAWALKRSYVDTILKGILNSQEIERADGEEHLDILSLVNKKFEPFYGQTLTNLAADMGYSSMPLPKQIGSMVVKKILGVDEKSKIAEFEKAGIKIKTIRVNRRGNPAEDISFPAFSYEKLIDTPFGESDFYDQINQKYLFVIFRESNEVHGLFELSDAFFWQMPDSDVPEAEACYNLMRQRTLAGNAQNSVRSTENRCCHVRPKARNGRDTVITPAGEEVVKKSFWLNKKYVRSEIEKYIASKE